MAIYFHSKRNKNIVHKIRTLGEYPYYACNPSSSVVKGKYSRKWEDVNCKICLSIKNVK